MRPIAGGELLCLKWRQASESSSARRTGSYVPFEIPSETVPRVKVTCVTSLFRELGGGLSDQAGVIQ